ncbi:hypothetical protein Tco_0604469 [Tanacetum coccineum]
MDSIIPLGQKNTLAEYMILSGADNHPHMFDKDLYDSWKSRMELYMKNRDHRRMILESVENGPLIWPTVEENGVIRTKKYDELSAAEKIQAKCDIKATNIILQGLPTDINSLVKHPVVVLTEFYGRCIANNHHKFNNNLITEGHALVVLGSLNPIINLDSFKSQEPGHYSRWQGHSEARSRETSAKAVLMANISNYGSDIISEGSHSETILNDMDKSRFDNVVKIRTTPDARTKGEWGFEHTKAVFNNEIIPFLKSLKDIFNVFDRDLLNEIMEVQTIFDQMDAAVQQSSVDK